jgi:hypothetical protein
MSTLQEVQQWMQAALLAGAADSAEAHVLPTGPLNAAERLAIYQRAYTARLVACLEVQFKALKTALGEDLFRDFARDYLLSHPSTSPTLADLGQHFVAYLSENRPDRDMPDKEPWIDFMVELARFEWDLYSVFDRKGSEGAPQPLDATPDPELIPQRCLFLHRYAYPVNRYFAGVAHGAEPDIPDAQPVQIAFVRQDYVTRVFPLLPSQHMFLQRMQQGDTVAAALAHTSDHFGSTADRAAQAWQAWRTHWIPAGFFVLRG